MRVQHTAPRNRRSWAKAVIVTLVGLLAFVAAPNPAHATDYYNQLNPGQTLYSGESLWSPNRLYRLNQQGDGNLVLVSMPGHKPLWANGMAGKYGTETRMQGDGNVVSVHQNVPVWTTHTQNNWGATLHMQDDANVVVRRPGNVPIWATGSQHSGLCTDGDRNRSVYYANNGLWYNPVPPLHWSESYWTTDPAGNPILRTDNYKLEVRYNAGDRCSYALLTGRGGSKVYLDRSTNGGASWTGWLGTQTVAWNNGSTYTGAFRDGKGFWVRACSPRGNNVYRCTAWY